MIYKCKKKTTGHTTCFKLRLFKAFKEKNQKYQGTGFFFKILNKKAILIHKHFKGSLVYNKTIDL